MKNSHSHKKRSVFTLLKNSLQIYKRIWYISLPFVLLLTLFWKGWRVFGIPNLARKLSVDLIDPGFTVNNKLYETGIILLVTFLLATIVIGLKQAYLALLAKEHQKGNKLYFSKSLKLLYQHLLPLAFVIFLLFLFTEIGFFILIVPGLVLAYFFQFALISVILENNDGFKALAKSLTLVKNNFIYLLTSSLVIWIVLYVIHYLTRNMLFTNITYHSLVLPVFYIYFYLLYKELSPKS